MIAPAASLLLLAGLLLTGLGCIDAALNPNWHSDDTPEGEQ